MRELVRQEVLAAIADFRREVDERLGQSPICASTDIDNEQVSTWQLQQLQLRKRNQQLENENHIAIANIYKSATKLLN